MFNVDLSNGECGGRVVSGPRGELDVTDAVSVAAWLAAIAAGRPQIIVDLAGLKFIDSNGVAALARDRKLARQPAGGVLPAAPRQQVPRVLAVIRLTEAPSMSTPAWMEPPVITPDPDGGASVAEIRRRTGDSLVAARSPA
jgi:anti-anti-sigma factor